MTLSRRRFIALAGGGVVLAAATGAGAFALTRSPAAALAPWAAAGMEIEPRRRALSWAILAPNPHNLQPWIADLAMPDRVAIWRDPGRALPATDPFDRQITVGLGCFVELLALAAAQDGFAVALDLFPAGEDAGVAGTAPVAVARFGAGGVPDPLFSHAAQRRSSKVPFDMTRPVAAADLATALGALRFVRGDGGVDPVAIAPLRDLIDRGVVIESTTARTAMESVDLMRLGRAEIEASPDGIPLTGAMVEGMMVAGLVTRQSLADPASIAARSGLQMYRDMVAGTPALVWLATPRNTRADQIAAGRDWLRLNLATTGLGLGLHPVSQALQEYPEMAGPYAEAHARLALAGETVQMLGRLGHAESVPPSPRWPLHAKLRNG